MTVDSTAAQSSEFARMLQTRMQELGLSIRDVAGRIRFTYEHTRRIVRGESVPSRDSIKELCEAIGMPLEAAAVAAARDAMKRRYGSAGEIDPADVMNAMNTERRRSRYRSNPDAVNSENMARYRDLGVDIRPLLTVWGQLSAEQKQQLIATAQAWANENLT